MKSESSGVKVCVRTEDTVTVWVGVRVTIGVRVGIRDRVGVGDELRLGIGFGSRILGFGQKSSKSFQTPIYLLSWPTERTGVSHNTLFQVRILRNGVRKC